MKRKLTYLFPVLLALSSCGGNGELPDPVDTFPKEGNEEWSLFANPTSKKLRDDFAWGVDCGSLAEVEKGGGKYYNLKGEEQDLFEILHEGGSNFARFRVWNDPYDKNGNPYGGGTNDVATSVAMAKRAQAAGLKVLVDFHYSDSWADPGKYYAPKAWKELDYEDMVPALGEFTKNSLQEFKKAGVKVSAVQLGNEINPGIAGISSSNYMSISTLINTGAKAAKEVFPSIKTVVHYTNVHTPDNIFKWAGYLKQFKAMPDIIGLSYYPYWHGTLDKLQSCMNKLATDYDVDVAVVETAWGNTDEPTDYANNQFNSSTLGEAGGYATSTQAQVTELADIAECLANVPNNHGAGLFYWEPAWLPVKGAGWISKEGAYYNDHGVDWTDKITKAELEEAYSDSYCYSSWANQAWFDYTGHALESVNAYKHIRWGDHPAKEVYKDLLDEEFQVVLSLSEEWALPKAARVTTNLGAYREVEIEWNKDDVAKIVGPGYYTVKGTCIGKEITANVKAEKNFIADPAFEKQGCKTESGVVAPWVCETTNKYKDFGDCHIEAKAEMGGKGNQYLHWYSTSPFSFTVKQNLGVVPAGNYTFGFSMLSSYYDGGGTEGKILESKLYYKAGEELHEMDIRTEHKGFDSGAHQIDFGPVTLEADTEIEIGFYVDAEARAWGHADDFYFSAVIE